MTRLLHRSLTPGGRTASPALAILAALLACLAGCGKPPAKAGSAASAAPGSLAAALSSPSRSAQDRSRDAALHPRETLEFFGLHPGSTVVEVWPGAGWWTGILAPYLRANHGVLYAATFETPNPDNPEAGPVVAAYRRAVQEHAADWGPVSFTTFGPRSAGLAPRGSADLVLFFHLDNWMAAGLAEKAFRDAHEALKPGGVLGVVQDRAPPGGPQDPLAANGLVQEAYVKQLAGEAGFTLESASEVNAAAPSHQKSPSGPDRMTLRFVRRP